MVKGHSSPLLIGDGVRWRRGEGGTEPGGGSVQLLLQRRQGGQVDLRDN
jgi:hypothetical protein